MMTMMSQILAVVAPRVGSQEPGQDHPVMLILGTLALIVLIAALLKPRPQRLDHRVGIAIDPQAGEYVLIPGGIYRVLRPTSEADGAVALCADERGGGEFAVANSAILGIVPPPPDGGFKSDRISLN